MKLKHILFLIIKKGIPKYLPTSTLTQPLSEFEIDNIIKNALINGTCLDNEKIIHINNKLYNIYLFSHSFILMII